MTPLPSTGQGAFEEALRAVARPGEEAECLD